jgi:uncharacterized Zn finger protein (UPF0148 family)
MRTFSLQCAYCPTIILAPETVISLPGFCPDCGKQIDINRYQVLLDFQAQKELEKAEEEAWAEESARTEESIRVAREKAEAEEARAVEEAARVAREKAAREAEEARARAIREESEREQILQQSRLPMEFGGNQQHKDINILMAEDIRAIRQWITFGGIVLIVILTIWVICLILWASTILVNRAG